MEISNIAAISMKSWLPSSLCQASTLQRLSFCYNGSGCNIKEPSSFLFSCINSLSGLQNLSLPSWTQYNVVPAAAITCGVKLTYLPTVKASRLSALVPCRVSNEDLATTVSGESIMLDEQTLEQKLQIAIEEENYAEAARIRDTLRVLYEDSKASVLAVNSRFYNAFRNGDLACMQDLWRKGDNVCCVHPGASGISGYDLVMRSWEYVWVDYEFPLKIELKDVQVHVRGDVGYVTCVELVKTNGSNWGRQFATNVFERVDGRWCICIHHASPVDL
ncbi:hypothetical protein Nepgr_012039 [Nepenthes gracilis]|uniref:F-box protein SKIP8 n=1 Tax=Nepenthes gracilis TaxID=150966 RepID=A0AAD3XMJ1_NEPGR|nr:hypothetical protein Nepgr_012039 [Nepenthes gracilis]